jgi:hypothetical protein
MCDHVIILDTADGKIKLFIIGMRGSTTSSFTIKYVLKKSFPVDASSFSITLSDAHVHLFLIYYFASKNILLNLFLHFI